MTTPINKEKLSYHLYSQIPTWFLCASEMFTHSFILWMLVILNSFSVFGFAEEKLLDLLFFLRLEVFHKKKCSTSVPQDGFTPYSLI